MKNKVQEGQTAFDFDAIENTSSSSMSSININSPLIMDTVENSSIMNKNITTNTNLTGKQKMSEHGNDTNNTNDLDDNDMNNGIENKKIAKIDDYVPAVSPFSEEGKNLKSAFDTVIKGKISTDVASTISSSLGNHSDQVIPESLVLKTGYEISLTCDETPSTVQLDKRLQLLTRPLGGDVISHSVSFESVATSVFLPLTLEETKSFFDKFLKVQLSRDIKMSGAIYRNDYTLVATGKKEDLDAIRANWRGFEAQGMGRSLTQADKYLSMSFAHQEDFIKNSTILGVHNSEKDGVKFNIEKSDTVVHEGNNYDPKRHLKAD